jgi:hypothetical protein
VYARAAVAAVVALLISGDFARLGWDALSVWHLVFPYFWMFVLLEWMRARRAVGDGTTFLVGAAVAMLYAGVYAKDLQHGWHPLGVDWFGIPCAVFDWGMIAVLGSHFGARVIHRTGADAEPEWFTTVFLAFVLGAAFVVYGIKTAFNYYRADRMLGPTWLLADLLFAYGAWKIGRRAWDNESDDDEKGREAWVWAVSAFAIWLPGGRLVARFCDMVGLPEALMYLFSAAWIYAVWHFGRLFWRERGHFDKTELPASRPAKTAALWRAIGTAALILWLGADLNDARAAGMFSIGIDWPSRALFALAFLTARLAV